jgi:hypothetical protein
MAKLLLAGGGIVPDSLGAYLRETLPDVYTVVSDPIVCRREIAALVVGPRDLVVLEVAADPGSATDADESLRAAVGAVQAFLAEEFPALRVPLRAYAIVGGTSAVGHQWHVADPAISIPLELAEAIVASPHAPDCVLADAGHREMLAIAFRDREITPSQRTSQPFMFRSGGALGIRKVVWTIRDAVLHMDRYPTDGIYHLTNHTIEQWLRAEGAPHLAKLAAEASTQCHDNRQRGLEIFLVGTGLVRRPPPSVRPRRLDLGYVLTGETVQTYLSIRKPRGRGYLFGQLATHESYIKVEPRVFQGERVEAAVSVETSGLLIHPEPYEGKISVHTGPQGVSQQQVPVRFHVMPMPSAVSRYIGRPLTGLLVGGVLGALIGWLWGRAAIPEPGNLLAWSAFGPPVLWIALFAILWAALGAVRGLLQPPSWPMRYALLRWLLALGIWVGALGVFSAAAVWCWNQGFLGGSPEHRATMWTAALYGAALAALPAALQEIRAIPRSRGRIQERAWPVVGRWLAWAATTTGLLLALFMMPAVAREGWNRVSTGRTFHVAQGWVVENWARANLEADELLKQFYLYYYDRRAPLTSQPGSAPRSSRDRLQRP